MTTNIYDTFPKLRLETGLVPDLTIRFAVVDSIKKNLALFSFVQIKDEQTPEKVAYEQYGTEDLYWLVLLMNDMVDPFYDWMLTEEQLFNYVARKYQPENIYAVHHYEAIEGSDLDVGTWVNQGTPFSTSVTNYAYEDRLNEEKRRLKILNPIYLQQVLSEISKELSALSLVR